MYVLNSTISKHDFTEDPETPICLKTVDTTFKIFLL